MIGGHWTALRSRADAEFVLGAIRADASASGSFEKAVAPHLRRPATSSMIPRWLDRFEAREKDRNDSEDISPRTLGEFKRMRKAGYFARWVETPIFGVTYGALEDWHSELATAGLGAKSRRNVSGELRRFLRWLHRRGEIDYVPDFPEIPWDRKAPDVLSPAEQRAVLDAIAFERRGVFLAMAHTLRPGEARALDLFHWAAPDLLVQQAVKGQAASAPIRGLKERDWRVVGASDELAEWIVWRIAKASPAERLQRIGVPLFPAMQTANKRYDPKARWSHGSLWNEWRRACDRAKVRHISLYPGTKHTTATDLARQGVDRARLQRFLGHADSRSTDAYVVLGSRDVKDLVRRRDK
jgi:integrase